MYNFLGSLPSFLFFFSRQCFSVVYLGSFFMTMLEHHDQSNLLKKKCLTGFTVSKGQSSWSWSRGAVAEQLRIQNLKQRQTGHTGIFFFSPRHQSPAPSDASSHKALFHFHQLRSSYSNSFVSRSHPEHKACAHHFPRVPCAAPSSPHSSRLWLPFLSCGPRGMCSLTGRAWPLPLRDACESRSS